MNLDEATVTDFAASIRGNLIHPDDPGYDEARSLYNAMIDKRPALIVQCVDAADVIAAVDFARERDLLVAVRGGGHNGPGLALCDGGLVIDLSLMTGVRVNPVDRTVRVGPGCRWGDVDHAAHAFGLAVPAGVISTTGVPGLTLGGGHGYLTRKYGLTIDNLLEADVVLADGRLVIASPKENQDLFWALRGGGGNFGIVTSFLFKAHPVHTVHAGVTFWSLEQAGDVMRWYRDFMQQMPRELYGFFALLTVPPGPPFPEELHLKKVCGIVWCYTGPLDDAEKAFEPVWDFAEPIFKHLGPMPFPQLQSMFDPLYPSGHQWYWKGDFVNQLTDEAIELHLQHGAQLPTPQSTMHLYPIDGAVHDVKSADTAWRCRDAQWSMVIVGVDPDPAKAERLKSWTRDYWHALHPHAAGGAYINFMMEEGDDRIRATYGANYDRLVEVKTKYDPTNFFRVNQNIRPRA
ncbi:MAG: FAD-binding oxidoreductase [Phycisphaerales bacterium]|nr:MAG: FAD-binding oxidoreductase [Phycisphaerales bacterium]